MARPTGQEPTAETLISFESGHYKKIVGCWKGDSVWVHFQAEDGSMVHVNKEKVEYIQVFRKDKVAKR